MRKLLGLALALALLVPAASADILKNVKSYGEVQVIGSISDRMLDDSVTPAGRHDQYSNTNVRVIYGINFDLAEDVKANLTLAYYNAWGADDVDGKVISNNTDTGYLNEIKIMEANVVLKNLFCCLEAKVGRQFYGDEDSAIIYIGPNHYVSERAQDTLSSIDAVVLSHAGEMLSWDFVYGKIADTGAYDDSDTSLLGLDLKYNVAENIKVQGYFYNLRDGADVIPAAGEHRYTSIYGAKGTLGLDMVTLSAEYARNIVGEPDDGAFDHDKGSLLKIDAKLDLGAFTPRATIVRGENFQSFGNYRPGIIKGQAFDGDFYFENNFIGNLGVDMKFAEMDKFTFSVDGFIFKERNLKGSADYEADLWVKYAMNKNVELHAAVGGYHEHARDNTYKAQTGMLIRF
ncbi:hypothetical protein AAIR98_000935 [Elusimicrobium simillimum]|uniref:hypothetical protein n=1 Tax=Elusimicrobium simillimum TaxID=3143438 RepID=UPI003C6F50C4